jgi:hypothetical protein
MRPTPRVERLREAFLGLEPTASIDRARIETRVMKETEGEPVVTRRAKVFAATVREMPIDIYPDQLLTGGIGVRPRCANITPATRNAAARRGFQSYLLGQSEKAPFGDLSEDEKRELEELTPYWTEQGRIGRTFHYGHNIHGHQKVLEKGFLGIKGEAEERLARLDLAGKKETAGERPSCCEWPRSATGSRQSQRGRSTKHSSPTTSPTCCCTGRWCLPWASARAGWTSTCIPTTRGT